MLFKIVLFAVIVYLAACYAYGLFLLWKLYAGRKFQDDGGLGEHPAPAPGSVAGPGSVVTTPSTASPAPQAQPAYDTPAKAA